MPNTTARQDRFRQVTWDIYVETTKAQGQTPTQADYKAWMNKIYSGRAEHDPMRERIEQSL